MVTTNVLLDHWLQEHRNWWGPKVKNVPRDVGAALKSEPFYTLAISTDSAVEKYAEIPLAKPAKASFAFAMLAVRTQSDEPATPNELIVSLVQDGRAFVVSAPVDAAIEPIPACDEIWREYQRKSEEAHSAYRESSLEDNKSLERSTRLRDEGIAAFRQCFAQRAKNQAFFPKLTGQAQALIDRLQSK